MRPEAELGPVCLNEEACHGRPPIHTCRPQGMRPRQRRLGYRHPHNKLTSGVGGRTPDWCRIIKVHEYRFIETESPARDLHTRCGRPDLLREPDTWACCLDCSAW